MKPELKAIVQSFGLKATSADPVFSHSGSVGSWWVGALRHRDGAGARPAGHPKALSAGAIDHVMVVGIAGGLDPALPVGSLFVPTRVQLYPDGPEYATHPTAAARGGGGLMTTDGLFDDEDVWRPILERGFGAVDMEAAGVAEVCEDAGVDWSVYRGISDRPDEHIVDQAVFGLSKPDGSRRPGRARQVSGTGPTARQGAGPPQPLHAAGGPAGRRRGLGGPGRFLAVVLARCRPFRCRPAGRSRARRCRSRTPGAGWSGSPSLASWTASG